VHGAAGRAAGIILSAAIAALFASPARAADGVTIVPGSFTQGTVKSSMSGNSYASSSANLADWPLDSGTYGGGIAAISFENPDYNTNTAAPTVIAFGNGGGVTLQFATPIKPAAGEKDLGIFTAQGITGGSGTLFNANMEAAILVSADGSNWYTLTGTLVASPLTYTATAYSLNAPTMAYNFLTGAIAWNYGAGTTQANLNALNIANYTTPMPNDSLFNAGGTNAQRLALTTDASASDYGAIFGTSGGGNWFDISGSGLSQVSYVRLNGDANDPSTGGVRLDGVFANAAAVGPTPFYWDLNGATLGSGATGTAAIWNLSATNWNASAVGTGTPITWVNSTTSSAAVFSAGTDATGAYGITISGTIQTNSVTFNNGVISLYGTSAPSLNIGSGGITISSTINGPTTLDASLGSVVLTASQSWLNNGSQPLNVKCGITTNTACTLSLGGGAASINTISGTIADGSGTLTLVITSGSWIFTAVNTYSGGTTVSGGTLQTPQITGGLTIASAAKVVLSSSAGHNSHASIVNGPGNLSITSAATPGCLDLTDNGLIITGATPATATGIAAMIADGQITSSVVAAHTGTMIAYDFASHIGLAFSGGLATWGGQTITSAAASSDLLILPTLAGDLNLDGAVNFTDVSLLAPNLGRPSGQTWANGDVNGDGAVNFADVSDLAPNLGKMASSLSSPNFELGAPLAVITTPEPSSLSLLLLGGLPVLSRRRARHARPLK
jgi:autotransporter-associated beta strand protein